MDLERLRDNWDGLGRTDPWWAILFSPERHGGGWVGHEAEFFASGRAAVDAVVSTLSRRNLLPHTLERALDFGCGAGRLSQGLTAHFERVDGVDIAKSMIELAQNHNSHKERVHYHLNEASDLHLFENDTFDFILSIIVLQHLPNNLKTTYIDEFIRVLRPGGVAAFTIPSHADLSFEGLIRRLPNSWQNVYRRRKYGYRHVMEFHPMRRRRVESAISRAGGSLVYVEREYMAGPPFVSFLYIVRKPGL